MNYVMKTLASALVAGCFALASWAARADNCTHSKYGANDEIGAANLITPASVLAASKLIKKGETHPLGIVVDPNMPAFPPRKMMMQVVQPNQQWGRKMDKDFGWDIVYNDDVTQLWWGTGPQIDGLGHLGEAQEFYNCNNGQDFAALTGLKKLGIHGIPPLVARGVMVDMAKHFGV